MKILKAAGYPHPAIIILLFPVCVGLLPAALLLFGDSPVTYAIYALSAYEVTVISLRIPALIRWIKKFKQENKYAVRITTDTALRVKLSLYGTVIYNTAYAVFQLGMGIHYRSFWFYSLAAYYMLLVLMRFFLLKQIRKATPGEQIMSELLRYRFCGIVLLFMNLALSVMVFFIVYLNKGYEYNYIMTIAMAAYTFSMFTISVVNAVKYKNSNSPVISATKAVTLATALVSMLSLETAMLTAFGDETTDVGFRTLMTALTGIAVILFIFVMAIYMIMNSNKKIDTLKQGIQNGTR